jgi:hypothetical protein
MKVAAGLKLTCRAVLTRILILASLLSAPPFALADSWNFPATRSERTFSFDDTRVVLTTDGTADRKWPDFIFQVFRKDQLQSQVHNVGFDQVFASADRKWFVGLSNRGIPNTAIVVFNDQGAITLLVPHGLAEFDYCEKSVTFERRWYDQDDPQVKFNVETKVPGAAGITLRDCRGRTVDIADVALKSYHTSYKAIMQARAKRPRR